MDDDLMLVARAVEALAARVEKLEKAAKLTPDQVAALKEYSALFSAMPKEIAALANARESSEEVAAKPVK